METLGICLLGEGSLTALLFFFFCIALGIFMLYQMFISPKRSTISRMEKIVMPFVVAILFWAAWGMLENEARKIQEKMSEENVHVKTWTSQCPLGCQLRRLR